MRSVAGKTYVAIKHGKPKPGAPRHIAVGERFATPQTPHGIRTRCGKILVGGQEDTNAPICRQCDGTHKLSY